MGNLPLLSSLLSEHCTSSLRATNRKCVASGPRRGASRPSRRTTRPPAASAARLSLQMAAATSAPTARSNSVLAVEGGSLCAPIMWEASECFPSSSRTHLIPAVYDTWSLLLLLCVCHVCFFCFLVTLWWEQSVLEDWLGTRHRCQANLPKQEPMGILGLQVLSETNSKAKCWAQSH